MKMGWEEKKCEVQRGYEEIEQKQLTMLSARAGTAPDLSSSLHMLREGKREKPSDRRDRRSNHPSILAGVH
jgi:hypothetical protein